MMASQALKSFTNPSLGTARLWRIEWLKMSRLRSFWIISGLYLLLIPLLYQFLINSVVEVGGEEIQTSTLFSLSGGALWDFMLFTGSYGVYLFVLLLLSYTNQERGCGLWRQYISDGMPPADLVSGKALLIAALSGLATLMVVLGWAAIILLSEAGSPPSAVRMAADAAAYGLYMAAFLSLSFALNLFIQRTALSFLLILLWGLVLESIIRWLAPDIFGVLLPVHQLNTLIPNPIAAMLESGSPTSAPAPAGPLAPLLKGIIWAAAGLVISYIKIQRSDIA